MTEHDSSTVPPQSHGKGGNASLDEAVGVVVIGRNEGERLKRCLRSLLSQGAGPVVYVDSGSTDGSAEFAASLGVQVVNLDTSVPFTMARGRNAGFEQLRLHHPELRWVQFVDGDCEVQPGWIQAGLRELLSDSKLAAVCGRRRERFPDASVYNRLADMEWDGPVGDIEECGGDAIYRAEVFDGVGRFNPTMIAGEEPELCVRIRLNGYRVRRIPCEMTLHDAAILRWSQWWTRAVRSGHSYAEGMSMHGRGPIHHNVRRTCSALLYGLGLPLAWGGALFFAASGIGFGVAQLCCAFIPLAYARAAWGAFAYRRRKGDRVPYAALYGAFCMLQKFPEAQGVLTYWWNRLRGRYSGLMEYKAASRPGDAARERPSSEPQGRPLANERYA